MEDPRLGPPADRLDPALIKLAAIVLTGAVVSLLDTTIVNVALATLVHRLPAGVGGVQWVSTAYLLALGTVIPVAGWSVDRFGARRMWLLTLVLFMVGSALCGVAWSLTSLIVFRVVQGVGGGMMLPLAQAIIAQAAGPARFGRAMSLVAIPAQLAPIIGPVLGGVVVNDLGWRWIFYLNVPICVLAIVLAWRGMPPDAPAGRARLDLVGLLLLSPGVAAVIYGFSEAGAKGGFTGATVLVPACFGTLCVVGFVWHSLRVTRIPPLLNLRLLRHRAVASSSALMFLFGCTLYGALFLMPLYYQQVRGAGALGAGLLLAPQGIGTMAALSVVGKLTDTTGPRRIVLLGMLVAVIGTIPFTRAAPGTNEVLLAGAMLVRGAGLGAATIPVMAAAYRGLERTEIPRVTSMINVLQRLGASFGTALLATILQRESAGHAGPAGLAHGFDMAFTWALVLTVLPLTPGLLLPSTPARPARRQRREDAEAGVVARAE